MGLRILHIAPFNTAGVPITFVRAERKLGHESRLITLGRDRRGYEEDICLDLTFLDSTATRLAKRLFAHPEKLSVHNRKSVPGNIPLQWRPNGLPERLLISLREHLWSSKVKQGIADVGFWDFDLYQLDGGLEFFRDGRTIVRLKKSGKKVISCYTGSDLRTRGVIPAIDAACDLNVTLEWDHLSLHPNIHHVFFPFDCDSFEMRQESNSPVIKIGHAPTNREAKGSDRIISTIKSLQRDHPVELVLIEGLPHKEALKMKAQCDIFVDQLGDLGYGINSLESLAMGIPTCSCLAPEFAERNPDHPFVALIEDNLKTELLNLVQNGDLRKSRGLAGREWVQLNHHSCKVVQEIHRLAGIH